MPHSPRENQDARDAKHGAKNFRHEAGGKIPSAHEPADRRRTAAANGARAANHFTGSVSRGIQSSMKTAKQAAVEKTPGTIQAQELRARCNKLTEAERRKLGDEAMRPYHGWEPRVEIQ